MRKYFLVKFIEYELTDLVRESARECRLKVLRVRHDRKPNLFPSGLVKRSKFYHMKLKNLNFNSLNMT